MSRNLCTLECECGLYSFSERDLDLSRVRRFQGYLDDIGFPLFHYLRDDFDRYARKYRDYSVGSHASYIDKVHCPYCDECYALWVRRIPVDTIPVGQELDLKFYEVYDLSFYYTYNDER